jgi:hypothetical protein
MMNLGLLHVVLSHYSLLTLRADAVTYHTTT